MPRETRSLVTPSTHYTCITDLLLISKSNDARCDCNCEGKSKIEGVFAISRVMGHRTLSLGNRVANCKWILHILTPVILRGSFFTLALNFAPFVRLRKMIAARSAIVFQTFDQTAPILSLIFVRLHANGKSHLRPYPVRDVRIHRDSQRAQGPTLF